MDDQVWVGLDQLRPHLGEIAELAYDPANARLHSERNLEAIAASLRKYGQRTPIVVQKGPGGALVVRKGNGTMEAAKSLGWTHIARFVVVEDDTTATGYAIADNRTAELAEWDYDVLAQLLDSLPDDHMDATGFDGEDLANILNDLEKQQGPALDVEVEELTEPEKLQEKWGVAFGDVWAIGRHKLLCGDSTCQDDVARLMGGEAG